MPKENKKRDRKYKTMFGETNPMWRGEGVGYAALHQWIKRYKKKPDKCENCGMVKKLDLANISQKYRRVIEDWEWLCRKCHMDKDGRLEKFKGNMKGAHYHWKGKDVLAKEIFEMYKNGHSFLEISIIMGRSSHSSVRSLLKRHGFIK